MNTKEINQKVFEEIFSKCMVNNKATNGYDTFEVSPCMTIRDFEIDSFPACDCEFTDVDKAWAYYQTVGRFSRIMDATGNIYADYYEEVSE